MRTRPRPTPEFLREFPWLAPESVPANQESLRSLPKALTQPPRRWPRKRNPGGHNSTSGG